MSKDNEQQEQLESRKSIAERIGCHPKTISRAERRGELVPVKLSSRLIRYRREDVEKWIKNASL